MHPHQERHASMPFWDYIQSLDPNQAPGRGSDYNTPQFATFFGGPGHQGPPGSAPPGPHGAGFEWGPWTPGSAGPWGHHGHHGHHGRRHHHGRFHRGGMNAGETRQDAGNTSDSDADRDAQQEKRDSPETVAADVPDPVEVAPEDDERPHVRRGCGRGGRGRRGGDRCGRGGFHHGRFGPHHTPGTFPGAHAPPPYPGSEGAAPFDFGRLLHGWAGHPLFRNLRDQAQRFQTAQPANEDSFAPPVDTFNTESAFILHVALPGAKKEDIGVDWDEDSAILRIAGVVHRPGDEELLSTLTSSERKVGMFERNVTLPPAGSTQRDEVDGFSITAKMEDGILIITVPKVEKEWTEIRKVDIE